jgi:hypothetical protein
MLAAGRPAYSGEIYLDKSALGQLEIIGVEDLIPLRYFPSGGVSMCWLALGWIFGACRALESLAAPCMEQPAMLAFVAVDRR